MEAGEAEGKWENGEDEGERRIVERLSDALSQPINALVIAAES